MTGHCDSKFWGGQGGRLEPSFLGEIWVPEASLRYECLCHIVILHIDLLQMKRGKKTYIRLCLKMNILNNTFGFSWKRSIRDWKTCVTQVIFVGMFSKPSNSSDVYRTSVGDLMADDLEIGQVTLNQTNAKDDAMI